MKILFIFPRPASYDSRSVREFPSGGTEKTVIFLGEAFQKLGHTVSWITTLDQLREPHDTPDVVITQQAELLEHYPNSKKVFWSHHYSDQPLTRQAAPFVRAFADKTVTLSSTHASDLRNSLKLDSVTIGHGVWLDEVVPSCGDLRVRGGTYFLKDPYRLIYASAPFRGLEKIPGLFKQIQAAEPRATIAIASSMRTYSETESDAQYRELFAELGGMAGVELLGPLNQTQLYEQYARASIFFYPCTWPETYCLAMDEAIAHGCKPLTTNLAALMERGACRIYDDEWVRACQIVFGKYGTPPYIPNFPYWNEPFRPKGWLEVAREWEEKVLA